MKNRLLSFLILIAIYALAFLGFYYLWNLFIDIHPLLRFLICDVSATIFIFIFSWIFKNSSVYDPYWSVLPMFALPLFIDFKNTNDAFILIIIVLALVELWGLRLTINWAIHFKSLKHEDWRYTKFRTEHPKLFPLINFTGIHLVPTIVVYLVMLSPIALIQAVQNGTLTNGFNVSSILAIIIALAGICFELIADIESMYYRKKYPGELLNHGIWKNSRHPNYLGEIVFWFGVYLLLISVDTNMWFLFLGPLANLLMFAFISIPLMEKHMLKKHPEYKEEITNKNVLLIFPKKKVNK